MLSSHVLQDSCVHLFSDNSESTDLVRKICESLETQFQLVGDLEELRDFEPAQPACIICAVETDSQQVHELLDFPGFDALAVPVIIACSRLTAREVVQLMERNVFKILHENLEEDSLSYWIVKALTFEHDRMNLIKNYIQTNVALEKLTVRQLQVLKDILKGRPTKSIASHMNLSQRMIEKERSFILSVFGVNSTSEVTLKIGEYRIMRKMQYRIDSAHDTATQIRGHLRHDVDSPLKEFLQRFGEL